MTKKKNMIYKPRDEINFLSVKIGVYGIGAIGGVVAQDLKSLGFDVNGWSRTKKNINGIMHNLRGSKTNGV